MKKAEWALRAIAVAAILAVVSLYQGDTRAMQVALLAVALLVVCGLLALRNMEIRALRTKLAASEDLAVKLLQDDSVRGFCLA